MAQMEEAEYWKEKGNAEFKNGKFIDAVDNYSKAMDLDPKQLIYPCNRAMALLKLKRFGSALSDCNLSLKLDPNYTKAQYRRSLALEGIGDFECAIKDLQALVVSEPKNKEFQTKLDSLKTLEDSCCCHNGDVQFDYRSAPEVPKDLLRIHVKMSKKPPTAVDSGSQNGSSTVSSVFGAIPEIRVPTTSYQLAMDWKQLRGHSNLLADYIAGIEPNELTRVFGNCFESGMMTDIIACLPLLRCRHTSKVSSILQCLPRVKRFSTVIGFISPEERNALEQFIEEQFAGEPTVLSDVRQRYQL